MVIAQQEHAEPESGGQDDADRRVAFGGTLAQQTDESRDDQCADQGAGQRIVGYEQAGDGTREGEFTGPVDGERPWLG